MKDVTSAHLALQNLISCYLETNPSDALKSWADSNWKIEKHEDADEASLKYLALVVLDAIESRAQKIILEKGCPVLIAGPGAEHMLPAAPESMLARGLEILREMCGMEGARSKGTLSLGIRNDSIELEFEKSEALHIIYLPRL
jgi:hypothetical protein